MTIKNNRTFRHKILRLARIITASFLAFSFVLTAAAQMMQSGTYKIQSDSINFGGGRSTSTSYSLESTAGEVGTGDASSTNYNLHAGYQQMHEVYLSLSSASNVSLSPNIGGITGGTANGQTSVTVITDSLSGYQMTIKASSSPALASGASSFSDYTPAGSVPDFTFSVASNASGFGFSPEGADIDQKFKDNGSVCNAGSSDTSNSCWTGLSTTDMVIAQRTTENIPSGTATTIKFRAQSGSLNILPPGTYTATTTITAVAL